MRLTIGLFVLAVALIACAPARAQDPVTYDPTFYETNDYLNPQNPFSPYARFLRQQRAKKQATVWTKVKNFAGGVASRVTSTTYQVVSLVHAANDPNNALPGIASGPGSPLQQPGSLTGSAKDAMMPTPTPAPLFGPTANHFNLFSNPFGTTPTPTAGLKQP
jgi:hypothetical protein